MIIRVFRARPRSGRESEYGAFLKRVSVPFVRRQTGCLEVRAARSQLPSGESEFVVISVWDSIESLRTATGGKVEAPVLDPEEAPLLSESDVILFDEL